MIFKTVESFDNKSLFYSRDIIDIVFKGSVRNINKQKQVKYSNLNFLKMFIKFADTFEVNIQ